MHAVILSLPRAQSTNSPARTPSICLVYLWQERNVPSARISLYTLAPMKLTFLGAAGTVTGSRYLIETGEYRILVDCGLFQGPRELILKNREPLPLPAVDIDAVVLTHAHIDHSGYLPALARHGFRGPVYCTEATAALLEVLLPDAARIQEEDARYVNEHHLTREPAEPLYTEHDARKILRRVQTVEFGRSHRVVKGVSATWSPVGHILGAACVLLRLEDHTILFSGDLGRPHDLMLMPPQPPPAADLVVVESTYGDRRHSTVDPHDWLSDVIVRTLKRGGRAIIPAFAVGRAQLLLHLLEQLRSDGRIPPVPVYLDSPMAIDATEIYLRFGELRQLSDEQCQAMYRNAQYLRTAAESMELNGRTDPMIVIAASGMATGGRVVHHLRHSLPDHRNTIILVGFQAEGTRGRLLSDGASSVRIHGRTIPVNAEIVHLDNLSSHADSAEITDWLRSMPQAPSQVFVTHGEAAASAALCRTIAEQLGWSATTPAMGDSHQPDWN